VRTASYQRILNYVLHYLILDNRQCPQRHWPNRFDTQKSREWTLQTRVELRPALTSYFTQVLTSFHFRKNAMWQRISFYFLL